MRSTTTRNTTTTAAASELSSRMVHHLRRQQRHKQRLPVHQYLVEVSLCFLLLVLSVLTRSSSSYSMIPSRFVQRTQPFLTLTISRTTSRIDFVRFMSSSNSNEIIEDDEDAKIFAALSSSRSSPSSSTPLPAVFVDTDDDTIVRNTDDVTYDGKVDWDAEWKAVVRKEKKQQQQGFVTSTLNSKKTNRPGSDYYKSDAEIAAIRAANEVTKKASKLVANVADSTSSLTDWNTIKYDWKIWIGLLVLVSFGAAALTSIPQTAPIASSDSYFI